MRLLQSDTALVDKIALKRLALYNWLEAST